MSILNQMATIQTANKVYDYLSKQSNPCSPTEISHEGKLSYYSVCKILDSFVCWGVIDEFNNSKVRLVKLRGERNGEKDNRRFAN